MSRRINPDKRNILNRYREYYLQNREYLNLIKMLNMVTVKTQKRIGSIRLLGLPYKWALEVTNICDSRCALCPVGEGFISRPKGMMKLEDYKKIIDKYKNYIYFLGLYNWGEPLLHPNIYEMINYAHKKRIYTEISTNLISFDIKDLDKFVSSGLNAIGISLHGISSYTYKKYQRNDSFDDVVEKIDAICQYKRKLKINQPKMSVGFVVSKHNQHEVEQLPAFAAQFDAEYSLLDASLNIRYLGLDKNMNSLNLSNEEIRKAIEGRFQEWLPQDKYANKYYVRMKDEIPAGGKMNGSKIFKCRAPWESIVVSWNGDVNFCCGVYKKENSVGNIFTNELRNIWNNNKYRQARSVIKNGEEKKPIDNDSLCTYCPGMLL